MMPIFFHRSNDYTGSTRVLANIIEAEYSNQKIIVVAVNQNDLGFLSELNNVKIRNVWYPLVNGKRIRYLSYIASRIHLFFIALIFGFRFETFYINTITPYPAVLAGWLLNKKIIYHVHEKFLGRSGEVKLMEYVFDHTRATRIFVSEYVKNQYSNVTCPVIIKYNKLSKSFVNDVKITPFERRRLCNILMISSLSVSKGVFQYVELAKAMPEYNFTLILSASIEEVSSFSKSHSSDNLLVVSAQSNIHPFLQQSDLLLNLSNPMLCVETFGLTIVEAMVYGIPAIVPNIGGPIELIANGYNGYCVDVTDLQMLRQKIIECCSESNYFRMATNSFERVKLFI